ncbi:MAG: methylated-DNA--[protein]-cysteine S-methyltransferase [Lachnospiraceae bacterium]|nr:methylated-DNA--[protein]-cysteine S-methyltransferase [Lachnospiraceae bacterium]
MKTGRNDRNQSTTRYPSPLGVIRLSAAEEGLAGLWFETGEDPADLDLAEQDLPVLDETKRWLDIYFAGHEPDFFPALHLIGTDFQLEVWELLRRIPYGETVSYGELAAQIAANRGIKRMSAQAVGGAVGRNPVSIVVPCHRVIGADGSLVGYGGGMERKAALLKLEQNSWTNVNEKAGL